MKKAMIRAMAGAVPLLVFAVPLLGQSVLLRMTPAEGLVSRYMVASESHVSSPMMPPSDGPISSAMQYQTETVVSADDDAIEILTAVDSMTMTGMPGAGLPDLSGMSYTVSVDARGRNGALADAGTLTPVAEEAIRASVGASFFELPEGEVEPGDAWSAQGTVDVPAGMGGTMEMAWDLTFTLAGMEGDVADITIEGTVTMSGMGGGVAMEGSGTVSGSAVFDAGMGRLRTHETTSELEINAGGMALSMTQNATRTLLP